MRIQDYLTIRAEGSGPQRLLWQNNVLLMCVTECVSEGVEEEELVFNRIDKVIEKNTPLRRLDG